MSEPNSTPTPSTPKAVTFESLAAASALIATKAEVAKVKEQVDGLGTGGVEYATTDEVLALFTEKTEGGSDTPSGGTEGNSGETTPAE